MAYLLRKFTKKKWEDNSKKENVNEFSADSVTGCIRTKCNTLSVWSTSSLDHCCEENTDLVVALALGMDSPATIDLIFLNEEHLSSCIKIEETDGHTIYNKVVKKHKDLSDLTYESLAFVSEHIVNQIADKSNFFRFTRPKLINLVIEKLKEDETLRFEELSERWQQEILKKFPIEER
ncbi:TPA: hypothetical protein ACX6RC_001989 [Photobacterium damselae]